MAVCRSAPWARWLSRKSDRAHGALLQACVALLFCLAAIAPAWAAQPPLTVFAAASLKESMDEAASAYQQVTGQAVRVSYAASSALARQIEQGAPADVFVSADLDWMDELESKGLVDAGTRADLLGNTLVLIAPAEGEAMPLVLQRGLDLRPLLGSQGRIALALVDSVPAGKYAKASLESLGMWDALAPRTAQAENVRAALLLVARGEAPLGVVYGSDAKAEPRVRVLATFPEGSHPPIVYPAARVKGSRHPQAAAFVRWLHGPTAATIFRGRGFSVR
jgi:molybdate transport system substrate-binding protein